jgi:hypothetical protein
MAFFNLGDKLTKQLYFHCLAATETKCDSPFSTEIIRPNRISLFKHLLEFHPPHYDSITQDFPNWYRKKKVRSEISLLIHITLVLFVLKQIVSNITLLTSLLLEFISAIIIG